MVAERGDSEVGRVGLRFRFWRREDERTGFADSSSAFMPRPMTSNPSSSLSSLPSSFPWPGFFFFFSFPEIANSSSSEGK